MKHLKALNTKAKQLEEAVEQGTLSGGRLAGQRCVQGHRTGLHLGRLGVFQR